MRRPLRGRPQETRFIHGTTEGKQKGTSETEYASIPSSGRPLPHGRQLSDDDKTTNETRVHDALQQKGETELIAHIEQ